MAGKSRDFQGNGTTRTTRTTRTPWATTNRLARGADRGADRGGSGDSPWVYGKHAVRALLGNPRRRVERLVAEREVEGEFAGLLLARPIEILERRQIDDLLPDGAVHQGVAVLAAPLPSLTLDELSKNTAARAVVLVLDQVTDPHNLGAILRSAAVFWRGGGGGDRAQCAKTNWAGGQGGFGGRLSWCRWFG